MKKLLTILLIFMLTLFPQKKVPAQTDSTITKKDFINLNKKDSVLSVKINDQIETVKQQINDIRNKKPERIVKFRTIIKRHLKIDSFYVMIDTCLVQENLEKYRIHDTIWMHKKESYPNKEGFFKRFFHKKKVRKDEMKVIE